VVVVVVLDQKQIATVTLSKCPHTQSVSNCQQLLVPVRKEQCLKEMTQKTPRAVFRCAHSLLLGMPSINNETRQPVLMQYTSRR
jgi:hypothetical protein